MFDNLSEKLGGILDRLTGRGALSEKDVDAAMREVRRALLEADVALDVVRSFTDGCASRRSAPPSSSRSRPARWWSRSSMTNWSPRLAPTARPSTSTRVPPVAIMMVGLQGSGKTTTTAKLARRLVQRDKRKVLMASLDVYRPAAMEQLGRARPRSRHPDAADRRRPEAGADRQARAGGRASSAATTWCCSTPPAAPRSTKR